MERCTTCRGSGRLRALAVSICTICISALAPLPVSADPPSSPGEMLQIAELNDVFFLDAQKGWAVGERGVIWHTQDGGQHWRLVDSPATCRLESIQMASSGHGWIVGGWVHPETHKTSAFVLRTDSAGRKWTRVETPSLPGLKWASFLDARRGWAVGNSSASYPTGVFRSSDGGFAWSAVPLPDRLTIETAALSSDQQLVAVDHQSLVWLITPAGCQPARKPDTGRRRVHGIVLDGRLGWLVGDGGLVWTTRDAGNSWEPPRRLPPEDALREFDWYSVAMRGGHCWIAGSPGSCILHSADGGNTWQLQRTGHALPLRKIWFLDEQHGWAVGAFGSILATRDGGRTWQVQRQGAKRAALAGMFATSHTIPWEMFVGSAADEGYCSVVQVLVSELDRERAESPWADRLREAASYSGAASALPGWQFPLEVEDGPEFPWEQVATAWNQGATSPLAERLEELVIRQIRIWRPDVIMTDVVRADGRQPLAHFASQIVLRAVQRAGDPGAFPGQLQSARLEPWYVKKTFTQLPPAQRGTLSIDTQRLAIHLGCSLAHYALPSRAILSSAPTLAPASVELRLAHTHGSLESARTALFSGLPRSTLGDSRREPIRYGHVNLNVLGQMVQHQKDLQELIARGGADANRGGGLLDDLDRVTAGLSPQFAGILLNDLARRLSASGDYKLAAEIRQGLAMRHPEHLLAEGSLLWLLRYYGSGEWQHALGGADQEGGSSATASSHAAASSGAKRPARLPPTDVQLASFQEPIPTAQVPHSPAPDPAGTRSTGAVRAAPTALARAAELGQHVRQVAPALYQEPRVQLQLASVHRRLDHPGEVAQILNVLGGTNLPLGWYSCVRGEQWLAGEGGQAPRPVLDCIRVSAKPYLDGFLDDAPWQRAAAVELQPSPPAVAVGTRVMVAHDDQFLYFAATCQKSPALQYPASTGARGRDAELAGQDRLELMVDVDRDYTTCFRLVVDHRGWTNDAVDDNPRWNPVWYVAAQQDDVQWSFEAAIPLAEISPSPPDEQTAWGIAIERNLAGTGRHGWSAPAGPGPPLQGSGYLIFR